MSTLYIDIETFGTEDAEIINWLREQIKPPANYSKPETIKKWIEENFDAELNNAIRKTALDALYGSIISIAWALDDEPVKCFLRERGESESLLLSSFMSNLSDLKDNYNNRVDRVVWCGHYISRFDLRFIWQRCVINRVEPTIRIPYDAKPWDDCIFDTQMEWTGGSSQYSGAIKLSAMSPIFGLNKSDINGSMVHDMYLSGKYAEIVKYNKQDVEDVRILHKRMTFQGQ
jgi:hypothetical protein